ATAVGDIPELLASGCGDTVPIGDLEAMAAAVLRRRDPELRRREGEQGRNTVAERWGLDAYRMRYDRLIFPARAEPSDEESPAVTGVAVAPRIEPRRNEAPRTEPPSPEPPSPEPPSPEPSSSEPTAPASPSQRIHGSAPALIRSPDRRAIGTSVVIPSYQHERYIEEAVRSALASDAVDEVVVLDDGSTDDSVPRLRALSDPRLRVDVQSNAGAHVALDRAIEQSRGEVIFILNSDDVFEPERVTALRQAFEDPAVVVAASWLRLIDDDGREIGLKHGWHDLPPWPRPHAGPGIDDLDDPALALLASNWVSTTSNVAVRRRLIDAGVRFRPLRYAHDWAFLLEACERGELAVVPKPLVRYRVHASNTIKEGADQRPTGRGEERGRARMRFEILWLLARHAATLTAQAAERGVASHDELEARLWRSVPRFGAEEGLLALLALRGTGAAVPAVYDRLLEPDSTMARRLRDLLVTP
ncbi:MAG: glycosyltransferase, partial [Acidobacteriota bacterium]